MPEAHARGMQSRSRARVARWGLVAMSAAGALILVAGIALYVTGTNESKQSDLGTALVSGAILSFAVVAAEVFFDARSRSDDLVRLEREERAELRLMLSKESSFVGVDLSNRDLSDAYLRGKDLRFANLRGANLRGADLTGSNCSDANLVAADLAGATITGVQFTRAHMHLCDLSRTVARSTTAPSEHATSDNDAKDADRLDEVFDDIGFHADGTQLDLLTTPANFGDARMVAARFDGAHLPLAVFRGADLSGCSFRDANLRFADFSTATLRQEIVEPQATSLVDELERCGALPSDRIKVRRSAIPRTILGLKLSDVDFAGAQVHGIRCENVEAAPEIRLPWRADA